MTDTAQPISGTYPPWSFQTIFADNVANLFRGGGVVKFYFTRVDPDISGRIVSNPVPVCQIVMPAIGFAAMAVFFQQQLESMVQKKEVDKDTVDQMKVIMAQGVAGHISQPPQGQQNAS